MPSCDKSDPESICHSTTAYQTCVAGDIKGVKTACAPGTNAIKAETPQQLNEYTLASVDFTEGLVSFNVNYNVSNVDQVYLPVAIEPMINADRSQNNKDNTPGYLGTTLSVKSLRDRLMDFTGATGSPNDPQNPTKWPIYTIAKNAGNPLYSMAGIRVPGVANVFNFLAQPDGKLTPSPHCAAPGCIPTISSGPWSGSGTTLIDGMITQWMTCTVAPTPANCPQSGLYANINQTFKDNYARYYAKCPEKFKLHPWFAPVGSTSLPNLYVFLQFVYGWVPFNVACGGIDLPTGAIPREYIKLQDNFQQVRSTPPAKGQAIFNPYAQLIHGAPDGVPPVPFGLDAAAYAYSIDDQSSFLSYNGVGLIFAVAGKDGLPNPEKYIFPPPLDPEHDIQVILGATDAPDLKRPRWQAYAICANPTAVPNLRFKYPSPTDPDGIQRFNVPTDIAAIWRDPCYLTLSDAANKVYQIELKKPLPWPALNNEKNNGGFDHDVISCPTPKIPGLTTVPGNPDDRNNWCGGTNEVANPTAIGANALRYELDTRPPDE